MPQESHRIKAGELRHFITLAQPDKSPDEGGGRARKFLPVRTAYAKVEPASSGEVFQAAQSKLRITHAIKMRGGTVDPSWVILFGTRTFAIRGIRSVDERQRAMVITCEEMEGLTE